MEHETVAIRTSLRIGDATIEFAAEVPSGAMTVAQLVPFLQRLTDTVVATAEREAAAQGRTVSCKAGCGACCRQLVPISEAEALVLDDFVEALPAGERDEVRARFDDARARLDDAGLLDCVRAAATETEAPARERLGLAYFAAGVACPFLVDESCSIHRDRPLSCREFLVTSPAAHCDDPGPGRIERVRIPARLSATLYRFGDGEGNDTVRWVPLVLALEWAAARRGRARPARRGPGVGRARPARRGPELVQNFLRRLAGG